MQALVAMTLQSVSQHETENPRASRVRLIAEVLHPALNAIYLLLANVPISDEQVQHVEQLCKWTYTNLAPQVLTDPGHAAALGSQREFLMALCVVLAHQRSLVRLAAVRVTSALSQWRGIVAVLFSSLVHEPLLVVAAETFYEDNTEVNEPVSNSTRRMDDRASTTADGVRDHRRRRARTAAEEECMWTTLALANMCEFGTRPQV